MYLGLPGLRGFWPMSSVAYTNPQCLDISGNGLHLTNVNVAQFGTDGLPPYVDVDGVNQHLLHADGGAANAFDVTGTETYITAAQRGLTIGGWFRPDAVAASFLIGKVGGVGTYSYWLQQTAPIQFEVSVDGTAVTSVGGTNPIISTWRFIVGTFAPSTELAIFIDDEVKAVNVAGIPASIFDSASNFVIGANSGGVTLFNGKASMCFLCAALVPDATIGSLYQQTRRMYGR